MAPKARANRKRERTEVEQATSSSNPEVTYPEFHTHRYLEFYANKKVISGRYVDFAALRDLNIRTLFREIGWKYLMEIKEPVYPRLVRAFYANLGADRCNNDLVITCTLKGVQIRLDRPTIAQLFKVPFGDNVIEMASCTERIFDSSVSCQIMFEDVNRTVFPPVIKANMLPLRSRLIHHIITNNILPRAGHRDAVTLMDQFLLSCILEGHKTSFAYLMLVKMIEASENVREVNPPYGMLLTKIFKAFNVSLDDEPLVQNPSSDYNLSSLTLMGYTKRDDGVWVPRVRREAQEHGEEAGGEREGGGMEGHGQARDHNAYGEQGIASIHERLDRYEARLNEFIGQSNANYQAILQAQDQLSRRLADDRSFIQSSLDGMHSHIDESFGSLQSWMQHQFQNLSFRGPPPPDA